MNKRFSQWYNDVILTSIRAVVIFLSICVVGVWGAGNELAVSIEEIESATDFEKNRVVYENNLVHDAISSGLLTNHHQNNSKASHFKKKSLSEYANLPADRINDHCFKTGPPSMFPEAECAKAFSGHHATGAFNAGNDSWQKDRFSNHFRIFI